MFEDGTLIFERCSDVSQNVCEEDQHNVPVLYSGYLALASGIGLLQVIAITPYQAGHAASEHFVDWDSMS